MIRPLALTGLLVTWCAAAADPLVVELWPGKAPDETANIGPEQVRMSPQLERKQVEVTEPTKLITAVTKPTITIYRPAKEKDTGTAVLICPGGGYWNLYWQLEGEEVAAWLNSIGVTGIILKYRVPRRPGEPQKEPASRPLQDAQRAVSLVRSKGSEWHIDPRHIGIIGFSAGGHLAIATATSFDKRTYEPIDEIDKISCRPDFAIPVYSGYLKATNKDEIAQGLQVPTNTPPVFLVHGSDDIVSPPEHSLFMYLALKRAGIPAELHIYADTTHDFGVRKTDRPYSAWTEACAAWLKDQGLLSRSEEAASTHSSTPSNTVRIAAAQAARRVVDFRLKPDAALAVVEKNLTELEKIVVRAGEEKCDALVLPEDTAGLLNWMGANEASAKEVLPKAVSRMIERLGGAAARHKMYLVVCSDFIESDGGIYNTAFLLGRDGKEIGRYHKVCPTWSEAGVRTRGNSFPVFPTADLGTAGLLICYDLVVPETARCLALAGADIIFFPTMGGAAIGDDDIGVQALRVRAAENFIWLIVAHRGGGAMIISPQGKIVATAEGPDGLAIADIDPRGQREGGDAFNHQRDMRARLFRERNPEAFSILTDSHAPVLDKVPIDLTSPEAGRIMGRGLTVGDEEFMEANRLVRRGQTNDAILAFERLRKEYPATWIDRRSEERLAALKPVASKSGPTQGLAAKYPGDANIASDPDVLFAENFETGDMKKWDQERRSVMTEEKPNSGKWCVQMPMERGKNHGADAIKWFMPGADTVYARFYVKFSPDYQYNHHFVWLGANQRTNKWSAFGKAGLKPNGTYYSTGMEPWFAWGKNPSPGEVNLYTYYLDMEPDRKMDKYWGNGFFPPGPGKGTAAGPDRVIPPLNQWQCWEFMIQANTAPDKADGKQAMWVDGKLIGEFTGIRWRNDMDLKVNCFWLEHYGYDEGDPTKQYWKDTQSVWFDDVVVARRYIGPIQR